MFLSTNLNRRCAGLSTNDDCNNIILSMTKDGATFKSLRLVCKKFHDYFGSSTCERYYEWVDRLCDHKRSIAILLWDHHDMNTRAEYIKLGYVRKGEVDISGIRTHVYLTMRGLDESDLSMVKTSHHVCAVMKNPSFTYDQLYRFSEPQIYSANPNCTAEYFFGRVIKWPNQDMTKMIELYGKYVAFDIIRMANRNGAPFLACACLLHPATTWDIVVKWPNLLRCVDICANRNILVSSTLTPLEILAGVSRLSRHIILGVAKLTKEIYDEYCCDPDLIDAMSSNPTLTHELIASGKRWNWRTLTCNPAVDVEFIMQNRHLPWNMLGLLDREDNLSTVAKYYDDFSWSLNKCKMTSYEYFKYKDKLNLTDKKLLENPNITYFIARDIL